jgi:hypothetical protein
MTARSSCAIKRGARAPQPTIAKVYKAILDAKRACHPAKSVRLSLHGPNKLASRDKLTNDAPVSPSFGALVSMSTSTPTDIVLADFNGDGKLDAAVSNYAEGTVVLQAGKGNGTFGSPVTVYSGGVSPQGLIASDLNRDGRSDLIITDGESPKIHVLLGHGDGSFSAGTTINAIKVLRAHAVDYNSDGTPDLVLIPPDPGSVVLLPGNGDGTFGEPVTINVDYDVADARIGDVNGDGIPDLILDDWSDSSIHVLLAQSPGQYEGSLVVPIDFPASSIALVPHVGTGNLDIVSSDFYIWDIKGEIQVFNGDGEGNFTLDQSYRTRSQPFYMTAADVSGDGIPDIVINSVADNTVGVLLGRPDGSYAQNMDYRVAATPSALAVGDVNGDGSSDIVTTAQFDSALVTQLNQGAGRFPATSVYTEIYYKHGVPQTDPADLNGDGYPDFVSISGYPGTPVYAYINHGNGDLKPGPESVITDSHTMGEAIDKRALKDVDGDGFPDLVFPVEKNHSSEYAYICVAHGKGDGSFKPCEIYGQTKTLSYLGVMVADINGDGRPDVLAHIFGAIINGVSQDGDSTAVYIQQPNGSFNHIGDFGPYESYWRFAHADFNDDGYQDVVFSPVAGTHVIIMPGHADGSLGAPISVPTVIRTYLAIVAADVNGDGKPDILVGSTQGAQVLTNQGNFNFAPAQMYPTSGGCASLAVGDLDGDGIPDIVCSESFLTVLYGDGDGTFSRSTSFAGTDGLSRVAVADLNGDQKPDIVAYTHFHYPPLPGLPVPEMPRSLSLFFQRPTSHSLPPVADNAYYYNTDRTFTVPIQGIDESAAPVTLQIATPPLYGTASIVGPHDNYLSYTTNHCTDFKSDQVGVTATSVNGTSNRAEIHFIFGGCYDAPPSPATVNIAAPENGSVTGAFSATDPDGDNVTFTEASSNDGTLQITDSSSGSFVYTPSEGFHGQDYLSFTVCDTLNLCSYGQGQIKVVSANPPKAGDASYEIKVNGQVDDSLPGSDPDGGPFTFAIVTPPQHGTLDADLDLVPDYVFFSYVPDHDYVGKDQIVYSVTDDHATATGTISFTMDPLAPTLTAVQGNGVIPENGFSGLLPFTVAGTGDLAVTASSNNQTLVPDQNIAINSNCGAAKDEEHDCTLTITPASDQVGSAIVHIEVADSYGQSIGTDFAVKVKAKKSNPTAGKPGGSGGGGAGSLGVMLALILLSSLRRTKLFERVSRK